MAINARLGYVYPATERSIIGRSVWWHFIFGVGVNCLFSFSGQYQSLVEENKQRYGSTLFLLHERGVWSRLPKKTLKQ